MGKAAKTFALIAVGAIVLVATGGAAAIFNIAAFSAAGAGAAVGVQTALGLTAIVGASAVIGAAFSAAIDWAMPDLPAINSETNARLNKTLNPEESRKIVFGETAASSDIRYWEAYGTDNKQYDEVIAVATHEIESFGNFYFETDLLSFDGSGDNTNQYGANLNKKNRTVGVTGTSLSAGAGSKWTANSSMTGCAFYVLRFLYDQELFPRGFPTRVTQVVKGAKVYDPRLDSTRGGVGPHRVTDQATWEYNSTVYQFVTNAEANGPWDSSDVGEDIEVAATTKTGTITSVSGMGPNYTIQYVLSGTTKTQFAASDTVRLVTTPTKTVTLTASAPTTISSTDIGKNPALQILWYLLGWEINSILVAGMGVNPDDIDFPSFITATNSCDTESYEGHCVLSTGDSHERNLSLLRSSCGGTLTDTGGRYSFYPAIDDTGVIAASFDDSDVVGGYNWVPKAKMRSQFNEIAGSFIDPSALYQKTAYPKVEDAAYVSADGFTKRRTVDFQTIQDDEQAQKLARLFLNRTRFQGVFQAPFSYKAMLVKNWDIVQLSFTPFGWTNELFRVVQQSITTDGQILLTLRQESSAIYAGGTINPALPSNTGSAWDASAKIDVIGLAATAITETGSAGTISDGIKVTWDAPSSIVSFTEVQYKINVDSDWIAAAILTQGETETKIVPAESGTLYDTRARHISISNVVGEWFADTVTTGSNRDTAVGSTAGATWFDNIAGQPTDMSMVTSDPNFERSGDVDYPWDASGGANFSFITPPVGSAFENSQTFVAEMDMSVAGTSFLFFTDSTGARVQIPAGVGDKFYVTYTCEHDGALASTTDADGISFSIEGRTLAGGFVEGAQFQQNSSALGANTSARVSGSFTITDDTVQVIWPFFHIQPSHGLTGNWRMGSIVVTRYEAGATIGGQLGTNVVLEDGTTSLTDDLGRNDLQEWDDVQDANITRPENLATNTGQEGFITDPDFIKTFNGGSNLFGSDRWWDRSNGTDTIINSTGGQNSQPALRMQGNGVSNTNCQAYPLIPVAVGDILVVRVRLKAEVVFNTAGEFSVNISELNKDKASPVSYQVIDPLSTGYVAGSWVTLEARHIVTTAATEFATVFMRVAAAMTSADQIFFDKVQAWKIPDLSDNNLQEWDDVQDANTTRPDDNADVTSVNTSADTTLVNGTAAATVEGGAAKADLGLNASGDLFRDILEARANSSNILRRSTGGLFSGELNADLTSTHTSSDTTNVNGVAAATVEGNAQTGQDLTEDNVTVVHRSSVDDVEFDFNEANRMDQGNTTLRNIPRGLIPGLARDGDSFTFTPAYDVPPVVQFGSGGIVYDSGNLDDTLVWGQSFRALNLTASGFTASLKLQELAGTPTPRTITGAASPATYDWEGNKSLADEAWDDKYTFLYDITVVTGIGEFGAVEFLTNDGGGWEVNDTAIHFADANAQTLVIFKDGMGLNDDFAMDAFFTIGGTFTGGNDPDYNVTYGTATTGASTSATPVGATDIPFMVIDNKDAGIVS